MVDASDIQVFLRDRNVTVHLVSLQVDGSFSVFLEGNFSQEDMARTAIHALFERAGMKGKVGVKKISPGILRVIPGYRETEDDQPDSEGIKFSLFDDG
jgi:hypothetical protein